MNAKQPGRSFGRGLLGRPHRQVSGSASVELALLMPLLFYIFFAVFDYGRMTAHGLVLASAARAGAQYGARSEALAGDSAGISAAVQADAADIGSVSVASATICRCGASDTTVNCAQTNACATGVHKAVFVDVVATAPFATVVPYPGIPASVPMSSRAEFRVK
jgi:Flp pilus assembly protein TadG